MGNKASKKKGAGGFAPYDKHSPMSDYHEDERVHNMRITREYVNQKETKGEKVAYGEGVPDVEKFTSFLDECKDMPLKKFLDNYSSTDKYISQLSFNPLEATYFDMLMDKSKRPQSDHYTPDDLALSPQQLEIYKQQGFVVTGSETSFAAAYYKIYNNDLPVLITADSILHAFHKSYDAILKELEVEFCVPTLKSILEGMREELQAAEAKFTEGPFKQSFNDTDFFLAVALNLLTSETFMVNTKTLFGLDREVGNALRMCQEGKRLESELFGKERCIDFSQFKPRGHYTCSEQLRQYFRAMTWLGKIDMTVAGEGSNTRQIGSAVLIHMLLKQNKEIEGKFHAYNRIVESLVGPPNSLDVNQLGILLNKVFKMKDYAHLNSEDALTRLRNQILETDLGNKKYNTGPGRSFTFLGQRFSIDSWAQSKLITNTDVPGANVIYWQKEIVERHVTSAVEVAFTVLGNNDAVSIIHDRITKPSSETDFRDGMMYHPYLAATRETIDDLPKDAWCDSIYMYWLATLRKLSAPLSKKYPQAMRTQGYAMKKMNTQLGSWSQIRHDNILYVEQLERCMASCDYPDGCVEPLEDFWEAMETLCMASAEIMKRVAEESGGKDKKRWIWGRLESREEFFRNFAQHVRVLREISHRQLNGDTLDINQQIFIKTLVEKQEVGSGGDVQWTGWYPSLYYGGEDDVEDSDMIVCDVFSNPPLRNDPGCVVHQGLGKPRRMIMAMDNGDTVSTYAGPVYDYYEFELEGLERLNDSEWKTRVETGKVPPPPQWTSCYASLE